MVPSDWPRHEPCLLAFVGEAPGQEEMEERRPFVGPAGRTLNAMLRSAGIERAACFIGNIFDRKLEGNSVGQERQKLGSEWSAFESSNISRLAEELTRCKPSLVVALGETAFSYLTGIPMTVGSVRGSIQRGTGLFEGARVFVTYHPSYVQRTWKMYSTVVSDLIKAKTFAVTPPITPKIKLILNPSIKEVVEYCRECETADLVSVDIETGWDLVRSVQFAPSRYEAMCIPFVARTPSKSYWPTVEEELIAWKAIKGVLEGPVPKLGQNFGGYDIQWLAEKMGIYVMNFTDDLMQLHKTMYPELPAGLAFMAGSYSEQGQWKQMLKEKTSKLEE